MRAWKFFWTALSNETLAFITIANSFKRRVLMLIRLLEFGCAESAIVSSFPLFPFFTSESTVIRLWFALFAKVLSTLIASNSLHCIVSGSLFGHWLTIIIFHIKIDFPWLYGHLIFASGIWTVDKLEHVSANFFIQLRHKLGVCHFKILILKFRVTAATMNFLDWQEFFSNLLSEAIAMQLDKAAHCDHRIFVCRDNLLAVWAIW